MMNTFDFEKDDCLVSLYTFKAVFDNGNEEEIIPAFHSKNRAINFSKKDAELLKQIDQEKLLDVTFNFCSIELFRKEGIELFDIGGTPIPTEIPEEAPRVLVYLDDAVTYWQLLKREILPATIKEFKTAKDAFIAVGLTDLFARPLSNIEVLGLDAAVTGNSAVENVWKFANEFQTPMNSAKLYLQITEHNSQISRLRAAGFTTEAEPEQKRTYEDAVKLYQAIGTAARGVKAAKSKYIISVINSYSGLFTLEEILEVLGRVSYKEGEEMRLSKCNDKETCIRGVLDPYFNELKERKSKSTKDVA